ncbi:MAG TPA: ferritin-like domain-containing protein [Alphaproteobacteria bacterium]|nr:ferritin-like domain-containing protein [Alphaproteobacteria bacterium]
MTHAAPLSLAEVNSPEFRIGSDEHKRAFCRMLLDTFDAYKPAVIEWPKLEGDALGRLTGLPFWNVAVQTEGYASARVQSLADTLSDPLLKEAVALNAFEEARHKNVLEHMLRFYEIPLEKEPPYAAGNDPEWSFIRTGYGECFDSFFAFGLFELARRSGYFPPSLVEVFEPVIREEGRHILFFVNWVAWRAANMPLHQRLWFRLRCMAALAVNAIGRIGMAGDAGASDNFVAAGGESFTADFNVREFLGLCLSENERRMAPFDARLLRPILIPSLVKFALRFIK